MSDYGRAEPASSVRPALILSGVAIVVIVGLALGGVSTWFIATSAAFSFAAIAYLAAAPARAGAAAPVVTRETPAASLAMARDVLEALNDPIVIVDAKGRVLFANHASEPIVGTGIERKHISSVMRTPDVLEAVNRVLANGVPEEIEFSFLVPVERYYRANIVVVPQVPAEGNLVMIQVHDLTSVRRAEQMRVDFVANASHELRTPLAAVSGFIETLRGHAKNDEKARETFLGIMSVEASRMQRLIADLLSLSRIELNEHNPPSEVVDVTAVLRDAAAVLAPLAAVDHVSIVLEAHEALFAIGERDELIQVFQNLIHNSIKYGRDGGTVRVGFGRAPGDNRREASGFVSVSITDEGEGIPREAIPRLTERFYRADVKRSRERGGTGLGLAIVKHILNRHHGRLHVESTPGQGSIFTVFLPASNGQTRVPDSQGYGE